MFRSLGRGTFYTWTDVTPPENQVIEGVCGISQGRKLHDMAFIRQDKAIMFGGETALGVTDETWIFDHSSSNPMWCRAGGWNRPPARRRHGMAFRGQDKVVLFGGEDGTQGLFGDTWQFDLSANQWLHEAFIPLSPSARRLPAMAERSFAIYPAVGDVTAVLFGGENAASLSDTWTYQPTRSPRTRDLSTGVARDLHPTTELVSAARRAPRCSGRPVGPA